MKKRNFVLILLSFLLLQGCSSSDVQEEIAALQEQIDELSAQQADEEPIQAEGDTESHVHDEIAALQQQLDEIEQSLNQDGAEPIPPGNENDAILGIAGFIGLQTDDEEVMVRIDSVELVQSELSLFGFEDILPGSELEFIWIPSDNETSSDGKIYLSETSETIINGWREYFIFTTSAFSDEPQNTQLQTERGPVQSVTERGAFPEDALVEEAWESLETPPKYAYLLLTSPNNNTLIYYVATTDTPAPDDTVAAEECAKCRWGLCKLLCWRYRKS